MGVQIPPPVPNPPAVDISGLPMSADLSLASQQVKKLTQEMLNEDLARLHNFCDGNFAGEARPVKATEDGSTPSHHPEAVAK